jgi:hypothetical protein
MLHSSRYSRARQRDMFGQGTGADKGQVRTGDRCGQGTGPDRGQVRTGDRCGQGAGPDRRQVRTGDSSGQETGADRERLRTEDRRIHAIQRDTYLRWSLTWHGLIDDELRVGLGLERD